MTPSETVGPYPSLPAGEANFTTVYPGWYQGRATHSHVEVARAGQSVHLDALGELIRLSVVVEPDAGR